MPKKKSKTVISADAVLKDTKQSDLIRRILGAIEGGRLRVGDAIPSISAMCEESGFGRDTVVKAYDRLKAMGVVEPLHGKGFFVATNRTERRIRILVMFDTLFNGFKEHVVQGVRKAAGERIEFDFFSHNFNDEAFARTLLDKQSRYERLLVMPYESKAVKECLRKLDQDKLILLDIDVDYPGKSCAVIRQDFDSQVEAALESEATRFAKYRRFELIFPTGPVVIPAGIKAACTRFCKKHALELTVSPAFDAKRLVKGSVYLVIDDNDLVALIKELHRLGWTAGKDVGVVSYNDTAMKEIVEEGVTVVSTDFRALGEAAAKQVLNPGKSETLIPTRLIVRKTL